MAKSSASTIDALARSIATYAPAHSSPADILTKTVHRLNILKRWFGTIEAAQQCLRGRRVLEVGCGRGDMTAVLAYMVAESSLSTSSPDSVNSEAGEGMVYALDPAPLSYGTPLTLGQCQSELSSSPLGSAIQWIQMDPIDYLSLAKWDNFQLDYVIFAHSLFYIETEDYLKTLLHSLQSWVGNQERSRRPALLVAEWGMRSSLPVAELHILVIQALAADVAPCGKISTVVTPDRIRELLQGRGWRIDRENWVASPDVVDGIEEAKQARRKQGRREDFDPAARAHLNHMLQILGRGQGSAACMDTWTCVFSASD